ncbi:MAG: YcgN family cysteine cluster protein [Sphingopyxis sp.]
MAAPTPFWEKPLSALSRDEWEALCDGCGKCCLHKIEDEDEEADEIRIYPTNVACKLLDCTSGRCTDYRNRRTFVPDCLQLTLAKVDDIAWLPLTCAYRLRADGQPLPAWHYLLTGDREDVHRAGASVRGWTISETIAGPLEHHVVDRPV